MNCRKTWSPRRSKCLSRWLLPLVNVGSIEARMVRTARYKYIVFAAGTNREQFFDMENDPGELKNLIAVPALAGETARHRHLLEQWRKETHDEAGKRPTEQGKDKGGNE